MKTNIRCHAFVSPDEIIVNAIVTYDDATMALISAVPFMGETPSTSHFDGIAILGRPAGPLPALRPEAFTATLKEISSTLVPCSTLMLQRM